MFMFLGIFLSSMTMFDELDYGVVEISYDARYRYQSMFYDSNFIGHALLNEFSLTKWTRYIRWCLEMLKTNNGMEFVSDHFE